MVGLVMFAFVLSLPDINRRQGLCRNAQGMGDELRLLFPLGMRAPQPDDLKWQVRFSPAVLESLHQLFI